MGKRNRRRLTAWVMAFIVGISVMFPVNAALAETPASLDADVSVTGIEEGGVIDGSTTSR